MNIRLTENYELRRMDSLNWRMFEHKLVEKKDGARGRKTGEKRMEWVGLECYPRDIESAIRWIPRSTQPRNTPEPREIVSACAWGLLRHSMGDVLSACLSASIRPMTGMPCIRADRMM